ncbi:sel1 repeat family protein [Campylobacter sp. faydin G-105]|uniref:tetratricopeptide repeat protein n=1 Tax=Campylobacter anatolicus TaxID=2829105 RepID=UPI001BA0183F|nr:tetratricopeptide repeat protein [Campylobacter anatolicus]MBR8462019.1 sel1 repeat family protein [Campylobacter anatolicus]
MKKFAILAFVIGFIGISVMASENYAKAEELFKASKYEAAYGLYDRACGEGIKRACTMNGILLFNGDGVKKDKVHAEQIFTKMCDDNEPMACSKLGEMYAFGSGKEKVKDESKVRALFKKSCDGGYEPACVFANK